MQRNAGVAESGTARSNDFPREKFSAIRSSDHVDIVQPSPLFEGETSRSLRRRRVTLQICHQFFL
jgi:hypothetical protein